MRTDAAQYADIRFLNANGSSSVPQEVFSAGSGTRASRLGLYYGVHVKPDVAYGMGFLVQI